MSVSVLPEQLARLFLVPIGRERLEDKRASRVVEILHDGKLANASITRHMVDCFFTCTGTLFYVFNPEDATKLFHSVYLDTGGASKATIGALYSLVCVASQYDDAQIDSSLRQSYYETAKFYLNDCIEEDVVLGMRVLCCLAMYCVMDKRLTAWTWILTGCALGRLRGIHLEERPTSTTPEEWIVQKKIMRTLIFLASWLSSTLGTNPEIVAAFRPDFEDHFSVPEINPTIESMAQEQMTTVGVLAAGILREVFLPEQLSLESTRKHQMKILDWIDKLPPTMQFGSLSHDIGLTLIQRRSIYLIHLNSLGAMLLLYRRHLLYLSTRQRDDPWGLDGDVDEALRYAEDAVDVATQAARVVHLLLSEKAIFKRCWLVIYQSFSACAVLLFYVAQTRLHGAPGVQYEEELSHAETCLTALDFCAQGDVVARGYHSMLSFYYNALKASSDGTPKSTAETSDTTADGMDGFSDLPDRRTEPLSEQLVDGVNYIIDHPFKDGWPTGFDETVPSIHAPASISKHQGGDRESGTTNVYVDAPIFGGPFQWSANSIPPRS